MPLRRHLSLSSFRSTDTTKSKGKLRSIYPHPTPWSVHSHHPLSSSSRQQQQQQQQQQEENLNLITSKSSNTVKRFIGLQSRAKKRREAGETVVEGPRVVLDLFRNPRTRPLIQQILISTDLDPAIQEELESLASTASSGISIQVATPSVLDACSDTVTPQGIVARVQIPTWNVHDIMKNQQLQQSTNRQRTSAPLYLVLDGVSDPGNVGTLLRSSVAVGVAAVLLLPGSCDVWNPKAIRSAMGGSFLVPTFVMDDWDRAVQLLQEEWKCHDIWAATMLEDANTGQVVSVAHYDIDWHCQPQALVIGNEGTGLSHAIRTSLSKADNHDDEDLPVKTKTRIRAVHVPMQGAIESLNAAVCGSVIMFEYMRQQQQQQQQQQQ